MDVSTNNAEKLNDLLIFLSKRFMVYYCIIPMAGSPRVEVANFITNNLKFKKSYKYLKELEIQGYISFNEGCLDIIPSKYEETKMILACFPEIACNEGDRDTIIDKNSYFAFNHQVLELLENVKKRILTKDDPELYQYFKKVKRAFQTELALRSLDLSLRM